LRLVETLEAQSFERRLLRMADARFDLPFAIGIADPAREGDYPVMREYIAIEGIERGVVDVRGEDPFFQIIEVMCPRWICGGPRWSGRSAPVDRAEPDT
jgi:hypothetical protein